MSIKCKLVIFSIALLVLDQVVKILVKTSMPLHGGFDVLGDWFKIYFIENNGMAFGMASDSGKIGKFLLSIFRIVAVFGIGWYILRLIKEKAPTGVLFAFALIFCGALGNIIDSMFYGLIFSGSEGQVASFLPEGGGYASFLHGRVVDMLFFPIWTKGHDVIFFSPVFNVADSYITIGVSILILFHRKFFSTKSSEDTQRVKTEN